MSSTMKACLDHGRVTVVFIKVKLHSGHLFQSMKPSAHRHRVIAAVTMYTIVQEHLTLIPLGEAFALTVDFSL